MRALAIGGFLVLHGFVHLWYVVLSQEWVDVDDQAGWNGRSWLLSDRLSRGVILTLASTLYTLIAAGFVIGGLGYALGSAWAPPAIVGASVLSTAVILALWDGERVQLVEKGVVGVVINLVLIAYVAVG